MKLHFEIFDKERLDLWKKLKFFDADNFLAGGTALALQIGHRKSYDFDIFSRREIYANLINKVNKIVDINKVITNNVDELTIISDKGIKITFLYYPFIFRNQTIKSDSLDLLSIIDIASSKAYSIGRRKTYRDYVDLYFILKQTNNNLKKIIINSENTYHNLFNSKLFLSQLVYFDDIPKDEFENIKFINNFNTNRREIENYFMDQIKEFKKKFG